MCTILNNLFSYRMCKYNYIFSLKCGRKTTNMVEERKKTPAEQAWDNRPKRFTYGVDKGCESRIFYTGLASIKGFRTHIKKGIKSVSQSWIGKTGFLPTKIDDTVDEKAKTVRSETPSTQGSTSATGSSFQHGGSSSYQSGDSSVKRSYKSKYKNADERVESSVNSSFKLGTSA